ncbi:hypothetical protein JTE90_002124 [Oedothorax gibbosus]|uniref:C2H2-type domain-containing protein n=1 Tax=Oedothorax gibbosus TaxID=931172 RepID=A0AAV6V7U8_9ARAC|nr:hypothetical protein JTE90_002124 [Oedothorax gibbosus]
MNVSSKHSCSLCETCYSCHKCLQYKASTFRGNFSESDEDIRELFKSSADNHFKDDDPQYIRVGPDNEKIATTPDGTTLSIAIDDNSSSDEQQAVINLPSWIDEDSDIDDPTWNEGPSVVKKRLKIKKRIVIDDSDDPSGDEGTSVVKKRMKVVKRTVIDDSDDSSWNEGTSLVKNRLKILKRTVIDDSDDPSWSGDASAIDDPPKFRHMTVIEGKDRSIKKSVVVRKPQRPRANWKNKLQRIQAGLDVNETDVSSEEETDEDDPQSFDCEICEKTFESKKDLKIHSIYHSTEEVHECKLCGMQFEYSFELIKHSINHRNPNNICEYCKKEFKNAERLRVHMASHTGEDPYFCVICGKGFKDSTRLKSHLQCHTDDKPFACETCGKCFRRKSQLKTHSWVHSEVKPYACELCLKPFNYKCNLQLHLQRFHHVFDD